jgi:glyoxylase-like metal-dependent hydrolase (beta-lactamase superfamily II)
VEKGVAPDRDCVEVSLFGPGYGECIVVHLGFDDWIVVDSCIEPDSGKPIALAYLEAIGVAYSRIALVTASHWDDDHIRGISEVFREATGAQFVCSSAMAS